MITTVYVKHELLFSLLTQIVKVVLHLIAFLKSFFLLKYLTGRVLLGRMVLIKKLLNCTDSIIVETLKIMNRVAIDICFPCIPSIQ